MTASVSSFQYGDDWSIACARCHSASRIEIHRIKAESLGESAYSLGCLLFLHDHQTSAFWLGGSLPDAHNLLITGGTFVSLSRSLCIK